MTDSRQKPTTLRISYKRFPQLPSVVTGAVGPPGLCVRLPRVLRYYGAEVEKPNRYSACVERLKWALTVENGQALAAALHLDFATSKMVWLIDDACFNFLGGFTELPPMVVSTVGAGGGPLVVRELVDRLHAARALGREYLFERLDFPSQTPARWAIWDGSDFVVAATYNGGFYGGKPCWSSPQLTWGGGARWPNPGWCPYVGVRLRYRQIEDPGSGSCVGARAECAQRSASARQTGGTGQLPRCGTKPPDEG